MKIVKLLAVLLLLAAIGGIAAPSPAAEVILKVASESGNYCHLKFPAIREDTLFWDHPVLQDPAAGEVIDFYGPCDHDPLGKEEIAAQRAYVSRERYDKANDE
ncbi:MAG: hypothetical protein HYU47_13170 [Deltaproteobacteria bacterium]|nr:hypothetical protein [Deltaproteobacteria bacterium]MBI2538684.1 hypothetical protein [Deltaproteobacteria bacterium]